MDSTHTHARTHTHTHTEVTDLAFTFTLTLGHHASIITMANCNVARCGDFTDSAVAVASVNTRVYQHQATKYGCGYTDNNQSSVYWGGALKTTRICIEATESISKGVKSEIFSGRACPESPFLKTIFHPKTCILGRTLTTFIGGWKCLLDTGAV